MTSIFFFVIRVPKRPVINTPVVSITVHDNDELLQHTLDKPITVQFRLVTTEERSKPICVFWNHTILWDNNTLTELMRKLDEVVSFSHCLCSLCFMSEPGAAAGQRRAARWFSETAPTSAVSAITWPALPCSWTSPGGRWVTQRLLT